MSQLSIQRKHNLSQAECTALAEDLLGKLVDQYGGKYTQQDRCFNYKHSSGMKAALEVRENQLEIVVKLNFMTRSFAPLIEQQINQVLDDYIV